MSNKIHSILLIDDSEPDNFYHKAVIKRAGVADEVIVANNALKALEMLKDESVTTPDLIFLDINMPAMDGWEFLEEYKKLPIRSKAKTIIVMLSTSSNPDDIAKANSIKEISEYHPKPLSKELLIDIVERFFKDAAANMI